MNSTHITGRPVTVPSGVMAWLLWALFGNADDGVLGTPDFHPTRPAWLRRLLWWRKNPAHNLTFYVLGAAHLDQERIGLYPGDVFAPGGGINWAVSCGPIQVAETTLSQVLLFVFLGGVLLLPFGWIWLLCVVFTTGSALRLCRTLGCMPFISYSSPRIRAYLGWRERGNLGCKLNLSFKESA